MELGTGTTFIRTASYDSAVVRKLRTTSIRSWNVQVWSTVPKSLMKTLRKRGSWNKTSVSDKCKVAIGKVSVRGCQGLLKCSMMFQNPQSGSRVIWSTATTFMTRRGCGPWGGGCSMTFGYRFFLGTNHIPLPFQLFQEVSLWKLKVFFFLRKNGFPHQWSLHLLPLLQWDPKGVPETFHNRNIVMRRNSKFVARGHPLTLIYVKVDHLNLNLI